MRGRSMGRGRGRGRGRARVRGRARSGLRLGPDLGRRGLLVALDPLDPPRAAQEGAALAGLPRRQQTEGLCVGAWDSGLAPLAVEATGAGAPIVIGFFCVRLLPLG